MWNQTTRTTMKKTTCGMLRPRPSKPGVPATLCTQNSLKDEQRDSMTLTRGEGAAEEGVKILLGREEARPRHCERSRRPGNGDKFNVLTAQDVHLGLARGVGGGPDGEMPLRQMDVFGLTL